MGQPISYGTCKFTEAYLQKYNEIHLKSCDVCCFYFAYYGEP